MSLLSLLVIHFLCDGVLQDMQQFFHNIGLTLLGWEQAVAIPLLTTMLLFLGPIVLKATAEEPEERFTKPMHRNPLAWRDLLVAPLAEEFVFRSLILAILTKVVSSHTRLTDGRGGYV